MSQRPGTPQERLPGLSLVERQPARRGSQRRAVAATAPRPGLERRVHVRLSCGHYTSNDAIAFYSVWQPREDEGQPLLRCETCHEWTPVEITERPETDELPGF